MNRIDNLILVVLLILSAGMSFLEIQYGLHESDPPASTQVLWYVVFAVLVSIWANKAPRINNFDSPFQNNPLLYFLWPFALPYYLYKTRGVEGFVLFIGFAGLYYIPFVMGLISYVFYT